MGQVLAFPLKQQEAEQPVKSKQIKKVAYRKDVDDFNIAGHLISGSIVGLLLAHSPVAFMSIIFGSLLPDIDHRKSTLGRFNVFARFMKHRGHTHSFIGAALISLPFALISPEAYGFALLGSAVHLIMDKLSSWGKFRLKVW
jgi:membrane-bound metal-dependent hydrolase YbcI (DUF457 family)